MAASGLAGAFMGAMQVKDCVLGVTPLFSTLSASPRRGNPRNLIYAIIGLLISTVGSFILSFIFFHDEKDLAKSDDLNSK